MCIYGEREDYSETVDKVTGRMLPTRAVDCYAVRKSGSGCLDECDSEAKYWEVKNGSN